MSAPTLPLWDSMFKPLTTVGKELLVQWSYVALRRLCGCVGDEKSSIVDDPRLACSDVGDNKHDTTVHLTP